MFSIGFHENIKSLEQAPSKKNSEFCGREKQSVVNSVIFGIYAF
jgi:hypothetical protein